MLVRGGSLTTLYQLGMLYVCILQAMDGEVYDKFRDAYTLYAQIEVDCANYVKANFEDLRDQASLVRH